MKKLFTVRTFMWSRVEVIILALCFVAFGILLESAYSDSQRLKKIDEVGKQMPVIASDYQIVIQEHDYVITQENRIVGVIQQTGQLDSLLCYDNL